jgi:hypothetical protein
MMVGWWQKNFNHHKDGQLNFFGHFEGWTRYGDQKISIAIRGDWILPNLGQPKDFSYPRVAIENFQSPQKSATKNIKVIKEF